MAPKPQEVPLFKNKVPWMLVAGLVGGVVFLGIQKIMGETPLPQTFAWGLNSSLLLGWLLHGGLGFGFATLYAVPLQLPFLENQKEKRFLLGLGLALGLSFLFAAISPQAISFLFQMMAARSDLGPAPLGHANLWAHLGLFSSCWLLMVVLPDLIYGPSGEGHLSVRQAFVYLSGLSIAVVVALGLIYPPAWVLAFFVLPLVLLGIWDMTQTSHSIQRNFPVIGHLRYMMEAVRPEIQQYFVESNLSGRPFSRDHRSVVYQRAKGVNDTEPFGTQRDVYGIGYQWINHSLKALAHPPEPPRILFGEARCAQPYSASLFNVSAMSFGALSANAIMALNRGAAEGGFAHNTGEGGLSPHHLQGGDLIWQIGTGYFGCRDDQGQFHPEKFAEKATHAQVKMIEIKLSQGAKPGHGGILPAKKVTAEISEIRGVPMGRDVLSPPTHSAFSTPLELLAFIRRLRELSGGKPVGIKLCVGERREFFALIKAMLQSGESPDFITVDGGEGGTGAAPLEFANSVGTPLDDGLAFVHSALKGAGLRSGLRLIAAGKITTAFHLVNRWALGADTCNGARSMMLALGCIQALKCNTNECPVGVATQHPQLVTGLVVADKYKRVASYHQRTLHGAMELLAAAGLSHPGGLRPSHIHRRVGPLRDMTLAELFPFMEEGQLLGSDVPEVFAADWYAASAESF